ncbi:disulfide bond formation protein B [Agaribacter marinus]|nr:disulfide bond formation protein B [Agaribacter marinus]
MFWLVDWSKTKLPWWLLFTCSSLLVASALYFQHALGHSPCVKCIYQRTAMVTLALSAGLPLIYMHIVTRLLSITVWLAASVWGLYVANSHVELIFFEGFFMPPCPIEPNFPSFMPLHNWLPAIFDATGECNDNRWQFLNMGMAEWMRIIFSGFALTASAVAISYIIRFRQVAK